MMAVRVMCVAMPRVASTSRPSKIPGHTCCGSHGTHSSLQPRPCSRSCGGLCSKFSSLTTTSTSSSNSSRRLCPPPEALGIYYSTSTGHTQEVAEVIKEALGGAAQEPKDIGDVTDVASELADPSLDGLLVGAPTWMTGADTGRSGTAWDDVLAVIAGLDLKGRKVAIFGCGDAQAYGDYFCDAMEELAASFSAAGADLVGAWPAEGYGHSESKAELTKGTFCGLALDQDNQGELTQGRVVAWTSQVMQEMGLKK